MPGKITLEVAEGPNRGKVFVFEENDTFIFGRARDCHARLSQEDTTASRHHFRLEIDQPHIRIRDLGSLNGTYINGKKYGGRKQGESPQEASNRKLPDLDLSDQDQICVGETVFVVRIHAPAYCCRCRKEIPEEFQLLCRWTAEAYICPQCKTEIEGKSHDEEAVRCARCNRDIYVTDQEPGSHDYICEDCRFDPRSAPVGALVNLLLRQKDDSHQEASLSNVAGYRLDRLLGYGNIGDVYLAHRKEDETRVALKIMLSRVPVDPKLRQRFHDDVDTFLELRHSNIVELYEHGSSGNGFYVAMEYCGGGTVQSLMQRKGGRLSLEEAGWMALQLLEGLAYAHQKGYVHRAIRPSSILLTGNTKYTAKLSDFGFTRAFELAGFAIRKRAVDSLYSAMFIPREQLTSFRHRNPVNDVWSMAATFYYMLTGFGPRDFTNGRDPVEIVLCNGIIPIRDLTPEIPRKVAKVIEQALSDNPNERYQDASEFHTALNKVL